MKDKTIVLSELECEKIKACIIYVERYVLDQCDNENYDLDTLTMHEFYKRLARKF